MYLKLFAVVDGTATEAELFQECVIGNAGDTCAINACKVEMGFAARFIIQMSTDPYGVNKEHGNGFDWPQFCNSIPGQPGDRYCCGPDYPDKFVYRRVFGTARDCC